MSYKQDYIKKSYENQERNRILTFKILNTFFQVLKFLVISLITLFLGTKFICMNEYIALSIIISGYFIYYGLWNLENK